MRASNYVTYSLCLSLSGIVLYKQLTKLLLVGLSSMHCRDKLALRLSGVVQSQVCRSCPWGYVEVPLATLSSICFPDPLLLFHTARSRKHDDKSISTKELKQIPLNSSDLK